MKRRGRTKREGVRSRAPQSRAETQANCKASRNSMFGAGSPKAHKISPLSPQAMNTLYYSTLNLSIHMTASTRGTHRWRVFVNRSCTSWNMGNCYKHLEYFSRRGSKKWRIVSNLHVDKDIFAYLVTIQRHLPLGSWYCGLYGTSTLSNGLGGHSILVQKKKQLSAL